MIKVNILTCGVSSGGLSISSGSFGGIGLLTGVSTSSFLSSTLGAGFSGGSGFSGLCLPVLQP